MILSPLSLLLLTIVGGFWLLALWRVIASASGVAQACFVAGYFVLAIVARLALPAEPLTPIWAPFLYPYAWSGIAALFWASSQLKVTRKGLEFPESVPRLSVFFLAQLALHLGIALTAWPTHGLSLQMYLMLPPAAVLLSLALYLAFSLCAIGTTDSQVGWLPFILLTLLLPLCAVELCTHLVPLLLRYY